MKFIYDYYSADRKSNVFFTYFGSLPDFIDNLQQTHERFHGDCDLKTKEMVIDQLYELAGWPQRRQLPASEVKSIGRVEKYEEIYDLNRLSQN